MSARYIPETLVKAEGDICDLIRRCPRNVHKSRLLIGQLYCQKCVWYGVGFGGGCCVSDVDIGVRCDLVM